MTDAPDAPHAPRNRTRDLTQIAVFAGIVAALGVVPAITIPGPGVPITLQTLGVMLAGAVLGSKRGFSALLLFDVLVLAGLPLLAGGRGGLAVLASPTVGYFIGFPIAAFAVGWLVERFGNPFRILPGIVSTVVGGVFVLYIPGIIGVALMAKIGFGAAALSALAFLPGDLAKAVIAALIARGVHKAYPGLIQDRGHRRAEATETSAAPAVDA